MSDNFYRAFEDRYRGSRELIKSRLAAYAPFYAPLAALYPGARVLDLGCGRGEWLELLGEQGFRSFGVDLDDGMLAACRERGLQVELTDALSALRATPDSSVAMVSAFHLVEHIPFEMVQDLIGEARRVLLPGGLLVMETPNPENLVVGASSFYMDPSHLRPIPPPLLDFVVGFAGYARQKVLRLQEAKQLHEGHPIGLIDVLDGVSPDYAVVGQKDAPPEVLAPFGAPFAASYGISLSDLALRFEEQDSGRRAELHQALGRLGDRVGRREQADSANFDSLHKGLARVAAGVENNRLRHDAVEPQLHALHAGAAQLRLQLREQEQREQQAQLAHLALQTQAAAFQDSLNALAQRTGAAEERAAQHQRRVEELLESTSWRVTAPLRMVTGYVYRLRNAARDGRIVPGIKRRFTPPLLALMRALLRRPRAKRTALAMLRRFPGLHARLYGVLRRGNNPPPPPPPAAPFPPSASLDDLTPRAQRIYQELKQAIDSRKN
ncbi:class I SAM-dependent methyltransferase [Massilia violaceinigra]|uniref:Class I SAM-dependent methyltransferase n=1 Tax=Massilia violaceinigra TaxID=2045208 RepID=A0ABY4AAL2_9BURK|nr:class I SAM-dependent methyltransferase [Massilia violaceinigra]UOD31185.1 class I SAM-dependent methyltransferase [Massilia violaceinigra]